MRNRGVLRRTGKDKGMRIVNLKNKKLTIMGAYAMISV